MAKTFQIGNLVKLGNSDDVPLRYRGRHAPILSKARAGRGYKYTVDFYPRRATPLVVSSRDITLA